MKNLIQVILVIFIKTIFFSGTINATTYYVSTTGSDSNPGTIDKPFKTLQKISSLTLNAGDIVYIRAGTYQGTASDSPAYGFTINGKNGTSGNPIIIAAYPADFANGGRVVFDFSNYTHKVTYNGVYVKNSSYITIKGIRVTNIPQSSSANYSTGFQVESSNHILIENCEADHLCTAGFSVMFSADITFKNCDAHHIDSPYFTGVQKHGNADGYQATGDWNTTTNITWNGCRAWFCSDDGWDLKDTEGPFTFNSCWAFYCGYVQDVFPLTHTQGSDEWGDGNGFKFGGPATNTGLVTPSRYINNCIAFSNYNNGFDMNGDGNWIGQLYNNTSYNNGKTDFKFAYDNTAQILKNNISYSNCTSGTGCTAIQGNISGNADSWIEANNSWNGFTVTSSDFVSLNTTGVDGARQADGSLPNTNFLHLTAGSKLIDKGATIVSLLFNGLAPDLGAFEYVSYAIANKPPVANAGADQTLTSPASTATLTGSATDADGTIASYKWTKVAGPSQFTIASSATAKTDITGLVQGIYQFELKVTDNSGATDTDTVSVTVNAAANKPPVANAGADQTLTSPASTATLTGSATDADGTIASYKWTKVAGPSQFTIASSATAKTDITGLVQGIYQFELKVTDNSGATNTDTVFVTIKAASNKPPVANAGIDQTLNSSVNKATLTGSATDADGTIVSYKWTKVTGPAQFTIASPATAKTDITGLVQGTYQFELKVTDNSGATDTDTVSVTVKSTSNKSPVAKGGGNKAITLPSNSVTLDGSASTDEDGSITSYSWAKIAGGDAIITGQNTSLATVTGLSEGSYTFELTVTDNGGASATTQVSVIVNAANQAPLANAGSNQAITLPVNSVNLDGSQSNDPDGTIASYRWTKISGDSGTIVTMNASKTSVIGLKAGQYTFELTVTDNKGAIATAQVRVTVNEATNKVPIADAGVNQTLPFGTVSTTLDGSQSSDPDGTIKSYSWVLVSGADVTITGGNTAKPVINGLKGGQYVFELTVTDDKGTASRARVKVAVSTTSNQSPIANAGSDQVIIIPANSTRLDGTRSADPDGTIVSYKWTKIDGPATVTITNVSTSTPIVSELVKGEYIFELTVTDNQGASATAQVKVVVQEGENEPPVADAGFDQTITLPVSGIRLDGSRSSDSDGTIVYYNWIKTAGPSAVIINNVNTATPTISGLTPGQYTFELTVTDNNGATAKDKVIITISSANNRSSGANAAATKIDLFPNPASNIINVKISNDSIGVVTLNIYDMSGRAVKKMELNKQLIDNLRLQTQRRPGNNQVTGPVNYFITSVNISQLNYGVYILETVIDNKTKASSKFVKY